MPSKLYPNGGRRAPDQGWIKFAQEVEEAAKRVKPKRQPMPVKVWANLRPGRAHLLLDAPRCQAIALAGHRCRQPAVRGSPRCKAHGGLLDVPDHPANIARREKITARAAATEARTQFYTHTRETREAVRAAMTANGIKHSWPKAREGAQALTLDDNGKAFRRWLASLKQT